MADARNPGHTAYFTARAGLDSQFLHPGGSWATEEMIRLIGNRLEGAHVVEIGCGTGSTARMLFERFTITYDGFDGTPAMLKRAAEKLSRYGDCARLHLLDFGTQPLPALAQPADVIVAESVLANVETRRIIRECRALLKAGGVIAFNDRIWPASAPMEARLRLNALSLKRFGFPAAPADLKDSHAWTAMLEATGFKVLHSQRIEAAAGSAAVPRPFSTLLKKIGRIVKKPSLLNALYIDYVTSQHDQHEWRSMENWIFIAERIDTTEEI